MASLTETAYYTRKTVKIGSIVLVILLLFRGVFDISGDLLRRVKPTPPPEPNVSFGKLPEIVFPETEDIPPLTFRLETIEETLPTFQEMEKVYFMPKRVFSYLTLERAEAKARRLGFKNKPIQLEIRNNQVYSWRTEDEIPRTLTMTVTTQNFAIRYDYERDQSILEISRIMNESEALRKARSLFIDGGFYPDDIRNGPKRYVRYKYAPNRLIEVSSLSETDFIKVNFIREDINELKVLPPHPKHANISALVSKAKSSKESILELDYTYFPVDQEVWGTYPLKDSTQAWDELKKGAAFIANKGIDFDDVISIRKVTLAYYDPHDYQSYLQPIFVFEGDKGFLAYVPAVENEWRGK